MRDRGLEASIAGRGPSGPLGGALSGSCHAFLRNIRGAFEAEAVGEVVKTSQLEVSEDALRGSVGIASANL